MLEFSVINFYFLDICAFCLNLPRLFKNIDTFLSFRAIIVESGLNDTTIISSENDCSAVCLFVCLSVSRITVNLLVWFSWNLVEGHGARKNPFSFGANQNHRVDTQILFVVGKINWIYWAYTNPLWLNWSSIIQRNIKALNITVKTNSVQFDLLKPVVLKWTMYHRIMACWPWRSFALPTVFTCCGRCFVGIK